MPAAPVSQRSLTYLDVNRNFLEFYADYAVATLEPKLDLCDFAVGNPHEMPLRGYVDALQRWTEPRDKDWFAYKVSEPESQRIVAATLRELRGLPFEPDDIAMTTGGFSAIAVALQTVVDPGDEVIMITPPWFFYEMLILSAGGTVVRVPVDGATFDLDLAAIEAAITPRTRAIIVNSPHNPTGRIYPPDTLRRLADILTAGSRRNGRTIYLLSDEAYSRIVFDGRTYPSPVQYYPNAFLLYTYGKTLLAPGQRIGYVALSPSMEARETLRGALMVTQLALGFAFPNALLQHALPDIERQSIDIEQLQHRRDVLTAALRDIGYDVHAPEGTFYLLPRSPLADDVAFARVLASLDVLVLPGAVVELPGYFRLSLTANDAMVERSLPRFRAALAEARRTAGRTE